jgi:7-keto-8-aminopelargonate synthetase-like enzyme
MGRALIVTDSVFSMEGDLAPLPDLVAMAEQHDALLLVDDAHATGVFGEHGTGSSEHWNLRDRPIIQMGTLSKALGALGGFVAGPRVLIDYLVNRARTFICGPIAAFGTTAFASWDSTPSAAPRLSSRFESAPTRSRCR